jgi:hypothetical protein
MTRLYFIYSFSHPTDAQRVHLGPVKDGAHRRSSEYSTGLVLTQTSAKSLTAERSPVCGG